MKIELPSTAWPCRIRHKPNTLEPVLTLDTAPYGLDWLINSVIIFISGVLRALFTALVLYLIYHWMITKPLAQMIDHLSDINPDHPGESALPTPQGHENNELGRWVRTANGLLSSIERNSRLRQEAEHSLQKMGEYDFLTRLPNRLLFQETVQPLSDLRYLLENYRTGQFVPKVTVYENYYNQVDEQSFGVDIEARAKADRKRVPLLITTILTFLDSHYPDLEGDEARRSIWTVDVPLGATHHLRNALNTSPAAAG